MVKVQGYKCEKCNQVYEKEISASMCEKNHIVPINFTYVYEKPADEPTFPDIILADAGELCAAKYVRTKIVART